MAIPLRQSTASQEVPLGYFVNDEDGNTAETGLTIANTDIKLWKQGATTLADKNSGGATHIAGGIYYAVLDATDTATLGGLIVFVHVAGALAVRVECTVLAANVYDALVAGTDNLQVHTAEISNDLITAAVIATGAIDADAIAANAIGSSELADGAITSAKFAAGAITATVIATDAIDADALATDAINEINATVDTALTDYDAPTKAELDSGLAALNDLDAGEVEAAVWNAVIADYLAVAGGVADAVYVAATRTLPKGSVITGFNDLSAAQVNAEVDTALTDYDAPTNAEMVARTLAAASYATATALQTVDDTVDRIEVDTQDLQTQVGTDGQGLTDIPWNADWDVEVQSEVADALAVYDPPTHAELTAALGAADDAVLAAIAALNNISAADVNAQLLDVLVTDTFAELAAVPAATASLKDKITWLYMLARNARTQTESTQTLKADNGSTNVATSGTTDNGSTLTLAEWM